jgi:DNA-binding NarL/FixJ family response regulator
MDLINKTRLKALFITSSIENNLRENKFHQSIHQFTDLVKTSGMDLTLAKVLPNVDQPTDFDLIFIDLHTSTWIDDIPSEIQQLAHRTRIVFFNAAENVYDEKQLLIANIKGIFYKDESLDIILRGITKLQKNELWFKRETMNSALNELLIKANSKNQLSANQQQKTISLPCLTRRENTIIGLVSRGAKNQEIADQLHISPNTVKTHLYSIFRKTSSRNRIELISRTQDYLLTVN